MCSARFNDLVDMYQKSVERYAANRLFASKRQGVWVWTSYAEFGRQVDDFRSGLAALGIAKGDVVAVIAGNRVEWAVAAYATYGLGALFCPMYEHQLEKDWTYIVNDAGAKLLLVSTADIYDRIKARQAAMPSVEHVIGIEITAEHSDSFAAIVARGAAEPVPTTELSSNDLCGFIYTSGTTGNPKGVLLSHGNITSNINAVHSIFPMSEDDCSVAFLPWAHSFGQTCELHCLLSMGGATAFAESIDKLGANFAEVQPTLLFSVPRVFNRIYDGALKRVDDDGGIKKLLFEAALANAHRRKQLAAQGRSSALVELQHRFFDRVVFSKVRARFGGRLKYAFSGGAALSPRVAEFIDNLGILVFEGYGLTETSPIACANSPLGRKIGSVGKAIPGVEIIIDTAAVEGDSGDGEILIKGPNIMQGYHNLPDKTAEVMRADGAFRSGDRGRVDAEGFVYITGRIKEQYKLENGKYVVPAPLEEQLKLSRFVNQIYIHGMNKPFNVALVVPDAETVAKWATAKGLSGSLADWLDNEDLLTAVEAELERYGAEFKGYERPRRIRLIAEEFSTDNDMMTPSMKIKRRKVEERYGELIEAIYD